MGTLFDTIMRHLKTRNAVRTQSEHSARRPSLTRDEWTESTIRMRDQILQNMMVFKLFVNNARCWLCDKAVHINMLKDHLFAHKQCETCDEWFKSQRELEEHRAKSPLCITRRRLLSRDRQQALLRRLQGFPRRD